MASNTSNFQLNIFRRLIASQPFLGVTVKGLGRGDDA
jgi:hypothetical protein